MSQAILVDVTHNVHGVASHWQDDLVLAAAVSGNADFLVTRDKEFRRVGEYSGVKIRTPSEFLIELDAALDSGKTALL
jgi:predicted nucleic acid-binding protein